MDYLAQQVGLWLLPRFTTRTNSAKYYAVVLFERWERFWALSVLESRGGALKRGNPDAFRGIRGATAAWRAGDGKLPLDFPLISRHLELGG